jgi:hypothetical protein
MKDHTKQHFDAPWGIERVHIDQNRTALSIVSDSRKLRFANCYSPKDANRFLCLPELYDALEEAIFEINRLTEAWENGEKFPDYLDSCLAENKKLPHENTMEWAALLCKVWKGEEQDK